MIVGEVNYPDTKKSRTKIKCDCCEISYSQSSYKKLLDNYKLLYLNTCSTEVEYCYSILCHDCFFDNLNKVVKENELQDQGLPFFILTEETELEMNFLPSDFYSEADLEGEEQVNMEDFIKEILEA
tara:strand:- start:374 stop:751 length:378 start_codon:yes stop_codon:yes gene_type:complete